MIAVAAIGVLLVVLVLRHRSSVRRRKDAVDGMSTAIGLLGYHGRKWSVGKRPEL